MYLQITSKCNMNCRHCGFSCNRKGIHMEWETFINAIQFIRDRDDETISIGGGEPTLHTELNDIIDSIINNYPDICIMLLTNGSQSIDYYKNMINKYGVKHPGEMETHNEKLKITTKSKFEFINFASCGIETVIP